MEVLQNQAGHLYFARALEATGFEFEEDQVYTVLLPSDGPADAEAADGTEGFGGFLVSFGYDTSSAESMQEHEDIDNLGAIVKQMILPGAFTAAELEDMAAEQGGQNDVRTLFDTEADAEACAHVGDSMHDSHFGGNGAGMATADGDVRVAKDGNQISIVDDSDFTVPANITKTDIPACGGSIVHRMDGWLSPCCLGDGDGDCASAKLSNAQKGEALEADDTATSGVRGQHATAAAALWAAGTACAAAAVWSV